MSRFCVSVIVPLMVCSLCTVPLYAEPSPSSLSQYSLGELMQVEVASLFKEDELTVGSTVSLVTEDQWRLHGAQRTFDALRYVPGVYVSEYYHGQHIPMFRGYGNAEHYNSFMLLLDGIPLNNYSSSGATYGVPNFSLGNLSSMEVIRGPGSSIHGADAFNGVVSMNTWTSDEDTTEAWVEGGSHGYRSGTARFRKSLADNVEWTSIFSASGIDDQELSSPYHAGPGGPLVDDEISGAYENFTTSQKLRVHDFEAAIYYSENKTDDSVGVGELLPTFPNGSHSDGDAEMLAVKLAHAHELENNFNLESMIYYVHDELFGRFGIGDNVGAPPSSPTFFWDSEDTRYGGTIRLRRPLNDDGSQMVFGYSFDQLEVDHLNIGVSGAGMPSIATSERRRVNGFMGQVEQRVLEDRLQLIAGVRHDDYSDFGGHTSPRLAAIYHPTQKSAVKFLYGNAYRTPSVNEQSDNGAVKGGGDELKPEQVDTYEIAFIKSEATWRYRVSTYISEVDDSIAIFASDTPEYSAAYRNAVSAESKGVELEAVWQHDRWNIFGNASWNESEQLTPVPNEEAYSPYPDFIFGAGVTWLAAEDVTLSFHNILYDGLKGVDPGDDVSPSFGEIEEFATYYSANLHLSWVPYRGDVDCEVYLTIYDLFDSAESLPTVTPLESGLESAGTSAAAGVRLLF